MYTTLLMENEGPTRIIILHRPKVLNALNRQLLDEFSQAFQAASADVSVKGIIITGTGEKAFAAGADISEFVGKSEEEGVAISQLGQRIYEQIERCPKPVIAAVNGFALGGGCELAMACHMRIAAETAQFGLPEVKLGVIPGYGGTQRLVRHIGSARAIEYMITGDMMSAELARQYGLVNYVTSQEDLLPRCHSLLKKAYKRSPLAISYVLDAVSAVFDERKGYEVEHTLFGKALVSEDGQEGTQAFLEKRKPNFTGT